jgi:hypothetical protein
VVPGHADGKPENAHLTMGYVSLRYVLPSAIAVRNLESAGFVRRFFFLSLRSNPLESFALRRSYLLLLQAARRASRARRKFIRQECRCAPKRRRVSHCDDLICSCCKRLAAQAGLAASSFAKSAAALQSAEEFRPATILSAPVASGSPRKPGSPQVHSPRVPLRSKAQKNFALRRSYMLLLQAGPPRKILS